MGWHRCSRYWKYGAACPVRGMPAHEEEEEEDDDSDAEDLLPVMVPERIRRPAEPGSVVAMAEAIVREVETREAAPAVSVPEWVPAVADIVVPPLFPTPADVVADPRIGDAFVPGEPFAGASTQPIGSGLPSLGDRIVEGTIAAGIGVAIGIVTVATGGLAVPWMSRIVRISRILGTLQPQAGNIGLPTARSLLIAAGAGVVRAAAAKIPDQPLELEVVEQAEALVEELVVEYVYPTAAERTVTISRLIAGLSKKSEAATGLSGASMETFTQEGRSSNPFGDWNDAFMAPGMYGPPPAVDRGAATGAGAGGYLYDFGQYLNSQIGTLEVPGGSPPPTTY